MAVEEGWRQVESWRHSGQAGAGINTQNNSALALVVDELQPAGWRDKQRTKHSIGVENGQTLGWWRGEGRSHHSTLDDELFPCTAASVYIELPRLLETPT